MPAARTATCWGFATKTFNTCSTPVWLQVNEQRAQELARLCPAVLRVPQDQFGLRLDNLVLLLKVSEWGMHGGACCAPSDVFVPSNNVKGGQQDCNALAPASQVHASCCALVPTHRSLTKKPGTWFRCSQVQFLLYSLMAGFLSLSLSLSCRSSTWPPWARLLQVFLVLSGPMAVCWVRVLLPHQASHTHLSTQFYVSRLALACYYRLDDPPA